MLNLIIIVFGISALLTISEFISYLIKRTGWMNRFLFRIIEVIVVIAGPLLFLFVFDFNKINDCCSESAFFSPEHRTSIYLLILLCVFFYFYVSYTNELKPPLIELLSNCFLITGIILNIFIAIHINEGEVFWLLGNVPIALMFFIALIRGHYLFRNSNSRDLNKPGMTLVGQLAWKVLSLNVFLKYPILLIICLPLLAIFSGILAVIDQRPDSIIKAFTDTYRQGLSELDYMCDNVHCEGHYLCTIAAKGHKKLVRPERLGFRSGGVIICNRQLMIANAFEELLEQRFPAGHRIIRRNYDKIGDFVHKYYGVFRNKFISDIIYIIMKPAEWFFLAILYICDKKPENRIAQQYLRKEERQLIEIANQE
jgi:hypothetical protein